MGKAYLTQYNYKGRGLLDKINPWLAETSQIKAGISKSGDPVPEKV